MEKEANPVLIEEIIFFPTQNSSGAEETDEMSVGSGCGGGGGGGGGSCGVCYGGVGGCLCPP